MPSLFPRRRRSRRAPSWRRTLLVAFAAQVLALMGFTLIFPFLPLYIQTLGIHGRSVPFWAGIISFSGSLPLVVMGPVWGTLGDRFGRKVMVIRAMSSGAVTMGLLIVAPNIWVLVALLMLSGLLTGVNGPLQALVTTVTPRAELGRSIGLMLSGLFTGVAIGPLAGGFLDDHLGFHGTFACSAGLLLAAALLVLFGIEEHFEPPARAQEQGILAPFKAFLAVAMTPGLLLIALVLFMAQTSSMTPAPVLPLFVPHLAGVPVVHGVAQTSTAVGLILAVSGLCAALSSWLAPRLIRSHGYRQVLVGALAIAGLLYLPAFFVQAVWQMVLVRAAVGLALGSALPAAGAIVGLITRADDRGAAYGLSSSAESCGFAVGPLLGGSLGALFGLRPVFLITGTALIGVALLVAHLVREPAAEPVDDSVAERIASPQSSVS
jgi:DHA1 family multidrug resistance protein-like MFS transporter